MTREGQLQTAGTLSLNEHGQAISEHLSTPPDNVDEVRLVSVFVCVKAVSMGVGENMAFCRIKRFVSASNITAAAHVLGRIDSAFSLCTHSHFLPLLSSYMYLTVSLSSSLHLTLCSSYPFCFMIYF